MKKSKEKFKSYGWVKMALLLLILLSLALGLGLAQAAMVSKQAFFERLETYINFANPSYRFVYIYPGMRKEQIVEKYSKVLAWNEKDKLWFIAAAPADPESGQYQDGYFMPKAYFVEKDATGKEVGELMHKEFLDTVAEEVLDPNSEENSTLDKKDLASSRDKENKTVIKSNNGLTQTINLDTAINIASIIEREAAGPQDMNLISGIIWNRLFRGMSLQMDATLQYAKGSEEDWWPTVTGKDKYIESPYNTYQNIGLPPGPISNPSIEAIEAAYNPKKTECLFYLHDKNRKIHCTKTYAEHKKNVDRYLK